MQNRCVYGTPSSKINLENTEHCKEIGTRDISTNRPSATISQIITFLLAPTLFIRKRGWTRYVSKVPEGPDGSVEINVAAGLIATS